MYTSEFPINDVTVDAVVMLMPTSIMNMSEDTIQVLLIERGQNPHKGKYALPGGFIGPHETGMFSAIRETQEETGVNLRDLFIAKHEDLSARTAPTRDPRKRVISLPYAFWVASVDLPEAEGADDAADALWVSLSDAANLDLAFDHNAILDDAIKATHRWWL